MERAAAGEEIFIAKSGKPIVKLVGIDPKQASRMPGSLRGRIRMIEDFDAPLPLHVLAGFVQR